MEMPEKGFYVHYKHDPAGPKYNYMYEVIGVGRNTEGEELVVMYRPLYKSEWLAPAEYSVRPLGMFMENIEKDGAGMLRFRLITDPDLIDELTTIRNKMYFHKT